MICCGMSGRWTGCYVRLILKIRYMGFLFMVPITGSVSAGQSWSEEMSEEGRVLRWQVGASQFRAMPEQGARLMSWDMVRSNGEERPVIYWPDEYTGVDYALVRGGIPILFPFAGASPHAGPQVWTHPSGQTLPMPTHGFVREGKFVISEIRNDGFTAIFKQSVEDHIRYPYDYTFTVHYTFWPDRLVCELRLTNSGRQSMPWSAGFHPYFAVPWHKGESRGDYMIGLPENRPVRPNANGTLSERAHIKFPLRTDSPLARSAFIGLQRNEAQICSLRNHGEHVRIRFGRKPIPDWDNVLMLWSSSADAPYYCVEPWMGPANAMETKAGLRWVHPGKTERFQMEISLTN